MDSDRERVGSFVVTKANDLGDAGIHCSMCALALTKYEPSTDQHLPSCDQLLAEGAVPVPNFGWLCGQDCATAYEHKFNVKFQRNEEGKVEYYPEGLS